MSGNVSLDFAVAEINTTGATAKASGGTTTAPSELIRQADRPWRRALLTAFAVWLTAYVVQLTVSALAYLAQRQHAPEHWSIAHQWTQWDALHYVRISVEGYAIGPGYPAFFPFYPIVIRLCDSVLPGDAVVSAWVVAHACAFGALTMLYRLAEHELGRQVAQRAAIYLAVFPMGFFLLAPYNTSLFLLLATGTLYAVRRGHWLLAGTLGALSSATRLFGVLLAVAMAVELLRRYRAGQLRFGQRRFSAAVLSIALVPMGVIAYMVYSALVLGNPVAFSAAQNQWGRGYTVPGVAWWDAAWQAFQRPLLHPTTLAALLDAGIYLMAAVLLVLAVVGPWRLRRDQFYLVAYSAATMILLAATEVGGNRPMQSSPRYLMEATVIFLVLARIGANQLVDRAVIAIGIALQVVLAIVFLSGTFLVA